MAAALLVSLIGAGFSAHALGPERRLSPPSAKATIAIPATTTSAHAALPDATIEQAAQDGSTGTTTLPDLPVPQDAVLDGSIHPARPFALAGTPLDKGRALQCLTDALYYEAAREPEDGQRAIAQVILNRVRHPAFPATVCGVVYQGSEKSGCQFSFACNGATIRGIPDRAAWLRGQRVALAALRGYVFAPVGEATHYHTFSVTPAWNRSLVMTGAFGAHFFHRWKGWWGTPAAFTQAYRGNEPLPEPHASIIALPLPTEAEPTLGTSPTAPITASAPAPKPAAVTPRIALQPAYAESGTPVSPRAAQSDADSQILDRWKDSGKPLR